MKNVLRLFAIMAISVLLSPTFATAQCGTISNFAGAADTGRYAGDGGPATAARFNQPSSVCSDRAGNVYVLDYKNARIRKIVASTGAIVTIAGNGTRGYSGDGGAAISAMIDGSSICCDDSGNVFISDDVHRCVRKVSNATGRITIIAGVPGGTTAPTWYPFSTQLGSICADRSGNVYVLDRGVYSVYKIDASNTVSLFCGSGTGSGYFGDGPSTSVLVYALRIGMDGSGNLYYIEPSRIRKKDASGYVSTVAGMGNYGGAGDGGPATAASISCYDGAMYVDSMGNIYFSQSGGYAIRKIDAATGMIHSVSGACCSNNTGWINSIVVSPSGRIIYADSGRYSNRLFAVSREYTAIETATTTDSFISTSCTLPSVYDFGVKGTIVGRPHIGDVVTGYIYYGDGASASFSTPYWDTVIGSDTVYGFGSDLNWLPAHSYTYPGVYYPSIRLNTINGYTGLFYPTPTLVGSVCDSNINNIFIDSIADSIVTAPCVFPATTRFLVHGAFNGRPSVYDSAYVRIMAGDGTSSAIVIPLDTTWVSTTRPGFYEFTATLYHNYSSPGTYYTYGDIVLNSGLRMSSSYGISNHYLLIDTCSRAGRVNSRIRPYDSVTTICSLPYTDTFKITGAMRYASDTISGIYYSVNYGDGSADTIYAPMTTDGYGYYICKASPVHLYTMPGAFVVTATPISPAIASVGTDTSTTLHIGAGCGSISGTLYRDLNGNCIFDSTETPLAYWPIASINNTLGDTTYYWCDSAGHYIISVITGESYTLMPDYFGAFGYGSDSMRVSCPTTGVLNIDTVTSGSYAQDFAFRCFGAPTDLDMGVYGWGFGFIPGDTGAIAIWASNPYGYLCDSLSSTVTLTLDSNLAYEGMLDGAAPTSVSGNVLSWVFSTANDQLDFNANVRVSCLSTVGMGASIKNTLNVSATSLTDPDTANNTYVWEQPALSSWDPNEIEVAPKGFGSEGYILNGTPLSYMIHFQNTGTARARNITITDTINSNLDIATLQLVDASAHVMIIQPERSGGNVVKFRFANIFLPDSGADMEGSNGYIAFNILPKHDLAAGTQITNKVGIYFDYNPAVITNTVLNTIEDTVGGIYGPDSVCVGATVTLTNHIPGGLWRSRNGRATVVGGVVTGVSTGRDTISYLAYNEQLATKVIYVNTVANPGTITGSSSVCEAAHTTLSATIPGGTWSSSSSAATVSGSGIVTGVTGGATDTIFYSITNFCGVASAARVLTINPLPVPGTISGAATSVCAGSSVTYTSSVAGGTWSSGSTVIAAVGSTGSVYGTSAGTTYISYSVTNACATRSAFLPITVNPLPVAGTITGPGAVCLTAAVTLTNSTGSAGGSWSSANTSIASVDVYGNVTGIGVGTTTITYMVNTATCGSAYATATIVVNPIPYAGSITGPGAVCRGANITLTNIGGTTGGVWSSSAGSIAGITSGTGVVTGVAAGSATITYTASTATCGSATSTATIIVNPLPVAGTITGGSAVCETSTISLSNATGTTGGNWSSSSTSIASISSSGVVSGLVAGTVAISYTAVTATCGNASTSISFTVNPLPVSGSISGTTSVCPGTSTTLTDAASGGTWISTNHHSSHSGGVFYGVSAGLDTIGYSVTNGCGTSVARTVLSVIANPSTAAITGPLTACSGSSITLSDAVSGGSWSVGSAVATISGSGVLTGVTSGTVVVTYSVTNFCGTSFTTRATTVDPLVTPTVGITATPGTTVCVGNSMTLTANPVDGGTLPLYIWKNFGINIGSGATLSYMPANGDAITCEMTSNASCVSAATVSSPVSTITVNPVVTPSVTISASADSVKSSGQVINFNATVTNGGSSPSYQWIVGGGAVSGATNASYSSTFTSTQTVYCAIVSSEQCVTSQDASSNLLTITVGNLNVIEVSGNSKEILVFPNPNNGVFVVALPEHENDVELTIFDVNGRVVKTALLRDNKVQQIPVDLTGIATGVYMIKTTVDGTTYYRKVVVTD